MPDIAQDFPIAAERSSVFSALCSPEGLDSWWTQNSTGSPIKESEYDLGFGKEQVWKAVVHTCESDKAFVLQMTECDEDWKGTLVQFHLEDRGEGTWVRFRHSGWKEETEHFRVTAHCWALYLRLLRRYLEHKETVPYEERLKA